MVLVVRLLIALRSATNFATAMEERGLGFGFSFLGRQAGFEIDEQPDPLLGVDTYGIAFLVGLLNTLFVSAVGIVLATILGIGVGVARLSPNWLLSRLAAGYVELMRNTPLLVQLFIIYFLVFLQLPPVGESISIGDVAFLNQRGLYVPGPSHGRVLASCSGSAWQRRGGRHHSRAWRAGGRTRAASAPTCAPSVSPSALTLPVVGWFAARRVAARPSSCPVRGAIQLQRRPGALDRVHGAAARAS